MKKKLLIFLTFFITNGIKAKENLKKIDALQSLSQVKFKPIFFKQWGTAITNHEDLKADTIRAKKLLTQHPTYKIGIIGQASAEFEGKDFADDLILSLDRADAIRDYFIENGIPPERITLMDIGDQAAKIHPSLGTKAQENDRRADIYVTIGDI